MLSSPVQNYAAQYSTTMGVFVGGVQAVYVRSDACACSPSMKKFELLKGGGPAPSDPERKYYQASGGRREERGKKREGESRKHSHEDKYEKG